MAKRQRLAGALKVLIPFQYKASSYQLFKALFNRTYLKIAVRPNLSVAVLAVHSVRVRSSPPTSTARDILR